MGLFLITPDNNNNDYDYKPRRRINRRPKTRKEGRVRIKHLIEEIETLQKWVEDQGKKGKDKEKKDEKKGGGLTTLEVFVIMTALSPITGKLMSYIMNHILTGLPN